MKCLECDANINPPKDSMEGEIVTCPDCGATKDDFEMVEID